MTNREYPMDFGLHQCGDTANFRERTSVRDWDERGKPTQMQLERRRVYIAIGSNLASPLEQVNAAVQAIGEIPDSRIVAVSSFYRTPPLGPQDQPDYLNAAVALDTALAPEELLNHTQRIELQQGRVRKAERWGPRTLDLDIMLFGDEVINTDRLTVPHYDMKNRGFMLWPLFEIAPDLIFPDGISLHQHLTHLGAAKPAHW